jgi:hypothetical protein
MRFPLIQAFVELILYEIFLQLGFTLLHSRLRLLEVTSRRPQPGEADRILQAVACACMWYPKKVLCLQRSAVITTLLRRCGIPTEMVIGAQRLPLRAHAWVEVDGRVVNDRPEVQSDYVVMERC